MEAATAPGRNLAMGIAAMGQGLGKAIEQYRTKKAETEAATQSWETVSGLMQQQLSSDPKYLAIQQYMETGALPQGVTEQDIPRYTQQVQADREMLNKFSALGEKFPDMSLAKKKAALGDAVMVLNQYRTDQQNQAENELRNLQTTAARFNLDTARNAEARRLGLEQAISQVAQLPTQQEMTVPAAPAFITSSLNIPAEQQPYTPFYQVQQIPGAAMQQPPPAVASYAQGLGRPAPTIPQRIPVGDQALFPQRMPAQPMPVAPVPQRIPVRDQPMVQRTAALPAGIARIPQQETPLFESQPIPRATTEMQAVPYQDRFRQAIAVFQRFNVPINPEAIRGVLEATGTPQPTTIEQVRDLGSVVRFGGKEQFVPRKETNIDDMLKIRGLTIDFPEFQGTAPSPEEAKLFREQYKTVLDSRRDITRLLEIAGMGKAMQQSPKIKAEADQLARSVQGALRLDILGAGTVSQPDRELLESIVRNPTDIFSLPSSNTKSLEGLLSRATNGITTRAQSLGLQALTPQAAQSRSSLASDPRAASIRARMNSGAITRQQAAQELQSLK
jgi:hypothetical protein